MTSPMSFRSTSSLAVCHPSPRSTSTSKSSCHLMALTCANPSVTMQHCRFYAHTPGAGGSRMGRGALTSCSLALRPGPKPIVGPAPSGPRPSSREIKSRFVDREVTDRRPTTSATCSPSPTRWPSPRSRIPLPPYRYRPERPSFASTATTITPFP